MSFTVNDGIVNQFHQDGFAVIPEFLSLLEVEELKNATTELVNKYCLEMPLAVFKGGKEQDRNTYFAESADKIRGFFEEKAIVDGQIVVGERDKALNKIGHALHKFDGTFNRVTFSDKVKEVVRRLTSMIKPTVIQSMVIFKQPKVGGEVIAHQDSTYLYTEPIVGSLLGFWIALDEATLENGCLHFSPGSHLNEKVYQRFQKNPDQSSSKSFIHSGEDVPTTPRENLKATPAKPGDLILIDGLVIHQSESNTSDKPRLAYTFHVIDMNSSYSPDNWLQPTTADTFMDMEI